MHDARNNNVAHYFRLIMGSHRRAIDAYTEAEKISAAPDWEIYYGLGKFSFSNSLYGTIHFA